MNYILMVSMALNIYLLIWVGKAKKILNGIKDLDEYVKQEKARTAKIAQEIKEMLYK